ncbi:DEAD/DEAH box helicase [Staphylococcus chromogenes]|uniref:DEAD/DEAH box helicase n=1 Tax=Staphylococcus chromogenes TaxID=46126 RepID=UPI0029038991|nr:DEAD/DEAH box helicase [Staphylococcus chromogenes]MDU0481726.1 DEAD/DEAH box helicase [Staphylococcus chromogenes]
MDNLIRDMTQSLHKGFIDRNAEHLGNFMPKLVINHHEENVLATIIDELHKCTAFSISVAFITESGLASLKTHLYELKQRGVKGRILTSNYLSFNNPKMYQELLKLENVEVRVTNVSGFHAKGYIFDHAFHTSLVIGSSNLTSNALKVNYEHNILLSSHQNGDLVHKVKAQFDRLWQESDPLTSEWIETYQTLYQPRAFERVLEVEKEQVAMQQNMKEAQKIVPNLMQIEALKSLDELRARGETRGLIVSATGTGKTIMSALDVRAYQPERFLFIVHNEGILRRAREDYQKVLADEPASAFGLLTGNQKDLEAKYLFATIQTISKPDIYEHIASKHFNYIIFDEAHRAAAGSYQRVFDYFKPDFMLGMTATPERNDALNVFELFHYNVAYEIRLQEALENDILCPFHYFGVTDYVAYGVTIEDTNSLQKLTSDARVEHVLERTHYYGYSGTELKGLIFVSRKEEARELAVKLTDRGFPTIALTGEDNQERRQEVIQQLKEGKINYIITVDLFNEGIDIPEVNQVIMLRATASSIIFVQQLGRGLRKSRNKDYVTVIDFIGNYKNNYLIPIALSGNQSQNKETYRKFLTDSSVLNGVSTINFEEVAKKKIFDSINEAKLDALPNLKEAYFNVKQRIGRKPLMMDFVEQNSMDPLVITVENKRKNYHMFLQQIKETDVKLSENASKNLVFLTREVAPGLKSAEHYILTRLIEGEARKTELLEFVRDYDETVTTADIETALRILDLSFFSKTIDQTYGQPLIVVNEEIAALSPIFKAQLEDDLYRMYVEDLLRLAQYNNEVYQEGQSELLLYHKYSRKDFVKIKNFKSDESSTVFGYKVKEEMIPIFVTYKKKEDVSENTNYGDKFVSQNELKWFTKSNRKLNAPEVQKILEHEATNKTIYVFVQKDNPEGTQFFYLGTAHVIQGTAQQTTMPNGSPVVTMHLSLNTPVRDDIYRYLVSN